MRYVIDKKEQEIEALYSLFVPFYHNDTFPLVVVLFFLLQFMTKAMEVISYYQR